MTETWNKPKEAVVVNSILKYLERVPNCVAWKNHGSRYSVKGMPDIIVLWLVGSPAGTALQTLCFAFEVKRAGTSVMKMPEGLTDFELWKKQGATDIQADMLEKLKKVGAHCYVVERREQVIEAMAKVLLEVSAR